MGLLSCCFPVSHEAILLKSCYPPAKQLPVTSNTIAQDDSEYKPLSQELSRLTYYATNKPGKLNRLAEELATRVMREVRKAQAGYPRYRIYLLISLSIARALVVECKTDLSLFSHSILHIIDQGLSLCLPGNNTTGYPVASYKDVDLEVAVRTGALFTAFETYADPSCLTADPTSTSSYLTILVRFSHLAATSGGRSTPTNGENAGGAASEKEKEKDDVETRNRTRLIGLAALSAAVQSDATFSSNIEFQQVVHIIVPTLLRNIWLGNLDDLRLETAKAEIDTLPSPFFQEFLARPPLRERRAPSLHAHVPGEKGPFTGDVVGAALRTLRNLVQRCHVSQISSVVSAVLSILEADRQWGDVERCEWLAEIVTSFAMLQYRYAVPATLLDNLTADADLEQATVKQNTMLSMLNAIFSARKISLVGISTTQILGSLVHLIVRRNKVSIRDPLLTPIVRTVEALSTHVYYADQANDLVEELASRIASVQATGSSSTMASTEGGGTNEHDTRQATIRVLVSCLTNLMLSGTVDGNQDPVADVTGDKGKARDADSPSNVASLMAGPSKRNPISPEVWQETLPLLCESTFAVRSEYARALLLYLQQELPAFSITVDGMDDETPKIVERFMHTLYATLYTLAMSSSLGFAGPALPVTSEEAVEQDEGLAELSKPTFRGRPSTGELPGMESPPSISVHSMSGTASPAPPRLIGRRMSKLVSLPLNRVDERPSTEPEAEIAQDVAGPKDYAIIVEIIATLCQHVGAVATATGVPMLIALDRDAGMLVKRSQDRQENVYISERRRACKEVVLKAWMTFARRWNAVACEELVTKASAILPEPNMVPSANIGQTRTGLFAPDEPVNFAHLAPVGESTHSLRPIINSHVALGALADSTSLQAELHASKPDVVALLGRQWSVESALQDSVEQYGKKREPAGGLNLANGDDRLRTISNQSSRSFSQSAVRGVDVEDLREALGGVPTTVTLSAAPSVATSRTREMVEVNGHPAPQRKSLKQEDVKDILKDILKEKSKSRRTVNGESGVVGFKSL